MQHAGPRAPCVGGCADPRACDPARPEGGADGSAASTAKQQANKHKARRLQKQKKKEEEEKKKATPREPPEPSGADPRAEARQAARTNLAMALWRTLALRLFPKLHLLYMKRASERMLERAKDEYAACRRADLERYLVGRRASEEFAACSRADLERDLARRRASD